MAKVKGHSTEADVAEGRITAWQRAGNDHADHFAKRGSALAEHLASTEASRKDFRSALGWYRWLAILVENWPADTQRQCSSTRKRQRRIQAPAAAHEAVPEVRAEAPAPNAAARVIHAQFGLGHVLYRSGPLHWCIRCGAYAETRLKSLAATCPGEVGRGPRAGQLGRLKRGVHPLRPKEVLQPPVRVTGRGFEHA